MTYLAFVDTETTGLHPNRRPWEVAIIRRDLSGIAPERSVTIQITDVDLSDADPMALSIGRHRTVRRQLVLAGEAVRKPVVDVGRDEAIVAAYRSGASVAAIGATFGCTRDVIGNRLAKAGISPGDDRAARLVVGAGR